MATFVKRQGPNGRKVWQVRVRKKGYPQQARTFDLKAQAVAWAQQVETEMTRGVFISRTEAEATTLGEALERYRVEITPRKRAIGQENQRIDLWCRHKLASRSLASIRGKDVANYIREREAAGVGANTIRLELALLSHLFTIARSAWGMESLGNPVALVKGSPSVVASASVREMNTPRGKSECVRRATPSRHAPLTSRLRR